MESRTFFSTPAWSVFVSILVTAVAFIAVGGLFSIPGTLGIVGGIIVLVAWILLVMRVLRTGVQMVPEGLVVRALLRRRTQMDWKSISDVKLVEVKGAFINGYVISVVSKDGHEFRTSGVQGYSETGKAADMAEYLKSQVDQQTASG